MTDGANLEYWELPEGQAYQIVDWLNRYEVKESHTPVQAEDKNPKLQGKPLRFIRWGYDQAGDCLFGLKLGLGYRRFLATAQKLHIPAMLGLGLFGKLLEIAGSKRGGLRGWIADDRFERMDAVAIAFGVGIPENEAIDGLKLLLHPDVRWVERSEVDLKQLKSQVIHKKKGGKAEKEEREGEKGEKVTNKKGSRGKNKKPDVSEDVLNPYITETETLTENSKFKTKTETETEEGAGSPVVPGQGIARGGKEEGDGRTVKPEGLDSAGSPGPARWDSGLGDSGDRVSVGSEASGGSEDSAGSGIGDSEVRDSVAGRTGRGVTDPQKDSGPTRHREIPKKEIPFGGLFDDHYRNQWKIRFAQIDLVGDDPKFLLEEIPREPEMRDQVLLWITEQWLIGVFGNELLSRSDQGQADRTTFFGRNGDAGLVREIADCEEEKGLLRAIRICQQARKKADQVNTPLRKPLAWMTKRFQELIYNSVGARPP
jgi:hypothetical protein